MRKLMTSAVASLGFAALASADEPGFQPPRYAFLPKLTRSEDGAVCGPFLAALTAAFKSKDYRIDLAGTAWPGAEVRWIFPIPEADKAKFLLPDVPLTDRTQVEALPIDLDHDGVEEVLASIYWTFNWQGDWHALGLYRSREDFDRAIRSSDSPEALFVQALPTSPTEGSLSGGNNVRHTWIEKQAVMINDAAYVVSRGEVYQDDATFGLQRINADASTSETCAVIALPDSPSLLQYGPVADFVHLVERVSGQEGAFGGTLHAQARVLIDASRAVARLAVRPWVLDAAPAYNSRAEIDRALEAWGRSSLYTHRLWRAWPEKETAARAALVDYYQEQFGLMPDAAKREAAAALDIVVRAYFIFPSAGIPALPDAPYRILTQALLENAPREKIESLLTAGLRIRDKANSGKDAEDGPNAWGYFSEEPTLFYALENPVNVAVLLHAGADPNVKGNFDKTALMYAAQFDLVDTAKVLLAAGAAINSAISSQGDFVQLNRHKRTPLMYAAENASPEMIRLLLSRGADATASDSTGRGVLYYLGLNERLSSADRAALAAALTEAGAKP